MTIVYILEWQKFCSYLLSYSDVSRNAFYNVCFNSIQHTFSYLLIFYRSVRVAPKKVGGAPSPGSSTPVPSATAAVAAAGTPVNNVAVVSTGDASQSTTAEAAAGESQTLGGMLGDPAVRLPCYGDSTSELHQTISQWQHQEFQQAKPKENTCQKTIFWYLFH